MQQLKHRESRRLCDGNLGAKVNSAYYRDQLRNNNTNHCHYHSIIQRNTTHRWRSVHLPAGQHTGASCSRHCGLSASLNAAVHHPRLVAAK